MSNILEQAVIDAAKLKEAALKNAEQEILEKYSTELSKTVDILLEQDELDPTTLGLSGAEEKEPNELADKLPSPHEETCTCPECPGHKDDATVVIDFGNLKKLANDAEGDKEPEGAPTEDEEDKGGLPLGKPEGGMPGLKEAEEITETEEISEDDEIEISEESIKETIEDLFQEILKVDVNVPVLGHGHGHTENGIAHAHDIEIARLNDTAIKKEREKMKKNLASLMEENKNLKTSLNKLEEERENLKDLAKKCVEKLQEINVNNAKLTFKNRVLESNSLNERQKKEFVEAISGVDSVEKVKVVFETLVNSSKGGSSKKAPSTLSEAVSKNNTSIIKSTKETTTKPTKQENLIKKRMQLLAGIKS